jgi:hypothetical protein
MTRSARLIGVLVLVAAWSVRAAAQPPAGSQDPPPAAQDPVPPPDAVIVVDSGDANAPSEPAGASSTRHHATMQLRLMLSGSSAAQEGADANAPNGYYNDGDVWFSYGRAGRSVTFATTAQTVVRYQAERGDVSTVQDRATVDLAANGKKATFHVSGAMSYSPLYQFGALPDAAPAGEIDSSKAHGDFTNAGVSAITSAAGVDLARSIGRYTSFSMSYARRETTFSGSDPDFTSQTAQLQMTRRLTRHTSFHAGYGYQFGGDAATPAARMHNIDVGLGYGGSITASGRTLLALSSGSVVVESITGPVFNLTADAALTRLVGRTGSMRAGYRRGAQLLEGFREPVMFDAVTGALGAALGRRVSATATGGYSHGSQAAGAASTYEAMQGAATLRWMLGRQSVFDTTYFYYRQNGAGGLVTTPAAARPLSRQGVRCSIGWNSPLGRSKG